jgi:hypothetical protein
MIATTHLGDRLIIGNYYHIHDPLGELIFRFHKENIDFERPYFSYAVTSWRVRNPNDGLLYAQGYIKNSYVYVTNRYCREATGEEINWLEVCHSLRTYIPKQKYLDNKREYELPLVIRQIRRDIGI